jgi:hypothetical protein
MTQTRIPARDIITEVLAADNTTWVAVGGLNSVTLNFGENEEVEDVTEYDSDGSYEERVMQRGASAALAGFLHKDDSTGALDTGQARIEALSILTGESSLGRIRFRHPVDTNWKVWYATFRLTDQGGGQNANTTWGATVRRSGASSLVAV